MTLRDDGLAQGRRTGVTSLEEILRVVVVSATPSG